MLFDLLSTTFEIEEGDLGVGSKVAVNWYNFDEH